MAKITNVLSLFDGLSCGQQALARADIKVNKYYASEIDKYAIQVAQDNYPNTIQLGSVTEVDVADLEPIDLCIGGSPCQSFSFAGKRNGMTTSCNEEIYTIERYLELKADGYQFEGESYLFWEYMRILTDIRKYNPDVLFLLENVEMGAKWERVLSEAIGIYGVHINSALVSAQNRKRIYWTNIRVKEVGLFGELHSDIPQPEDRGILLKDILEDEVDEKYYLSDKMLNYLNKNSELQKENGNGFKFTPFYEFNIKSKTITNKERGRMDDNFIVKRGVEVKKLDGKQKTGCLTATAQVKQNLTTDYVCISSTQKNATVTTNKSSPMTAAMGMGGGHVPMIAILIPEATSKGYVEIRPGECFDAENINSKTRRGRKMTDKSNSLMASTTNFMKYEGSLTADQLAKFNPDVDASKHNALTQAIGRGGSSSEYMDSVSKVSKLSTAKRYEAVGCDYRADEGFRFRNNGKSGTLQARARNDESCGQLASIGTRIRRLTPVECERLQTVEDNYSACVSDTQRYKMLGNGFTVDVIAHILSFLKDK